MLPCCRCCCLSREVFAAYCWLLVRGDESTRCVVVEELSLLQQRSIYLLQPVHCVISHFQYNASYVLVLLALVCVTIAHNQTRPNTNKARLTDGIFCRRTSMTSIPVNDSTNCQTVLLIPDNPPVLQCSALAPTMSHLICELDRSQLIIFVSRILC